MEAGLYLVGTPIGNLEDITLRALRVIREANLLLAEDTRVTRVLLNRHEISARPMSCHKFNEASRVQRVCEAIEAGESVALVTDGGMPGVSDPGSRLVRACRERELPLFVIPGPSAVTAAVALSGMGDKGFCFEGFLSNKGAARRNRLTALAGEKRAVVLFESPHRILKLLADIETVLGPCPVFVGRELSKKFEENCWGTGRELAAFLEENKSVRGEFTVVLQPPDRACVDREGAP